MHHSYQHGTTTHPRPSTWSDLSETDMVTTSTDSSRSTFCGSVQYNYLPIVRHQHQAHNSEPLHPNERCLMNTHLRVLDATDHLSYVSDSTQRDQQWRFQFRRYSYLMLRYSHVRQSLLAPENSHVLIVLWYTDDLLVTDTFGEEEQSMIETDAMTAESTLTALLNTGDTSIRDRVYRRYIANDAAFPRRLCTWGSNVSLT